MKQPAQRLSDSQRVAWLRLIRTPNVGPATFRDLINRFASADAAIEALPRLMRASGRNGEPKIPSIEQAEAEIEAAARFGARLVAIGERGYPPLLRAIDTAPPLLTIRGDPRIFELPALGIVGARNASVNGRNLARRFAAEIGGQGYAIISGLARGIDAAAHLGSLETGAVAALAGGLDKPYPPEHADLVERIVEHGAVISEKPMGWEPRAQDFPRRNRLIVGLAYGLLVVEAAHRSGSLISARLAGEMGRIVFAVPGSPLDPRAEGTNKLLKDGATLTTEAGDILSALAPLSRRPPPTGLSAAPVSDFENSPEPASEDRARLVEALGPTPVSVDELISHTGLNAAQVFMILLELDLDGMLERHAGGQVSLIYPAR